MKETKKTFDKTEDDLKALQSMGQIIGEVLRQLDDEKCASPKLESSDRRVRRSANDTIFRAQQSPTLTTNTRPRPSFDADTRHTKYSHREGFLRPALRGGRAHEA